MLTPTVVKTSWSLLTSLKLVVSVSSPISGRESFPAVTQTEALPERRRTDGHDGGGSSGDGTYVISAGSEIPPGWEKLPDMLGGVVGGRDVEPAAVVGCQSRTGCAVYCGCGLGWVSQRRLGIVKGAVGIAREEGPSAPLQIFGSTIKSFEGLQKGMNRQ